MAELRWIRIRSYTGSQWEASIQIGTICKDAAAGMLPNVSWVCAPHDASEHPADPIDSGGNPLVGNVTHGMQWTVAQVDTLVQGGLWSKSAMFITWDDWGGWFDHFNPPEIEKWSDGTQFRYGSRVGCLVLSPYAKQGYISKTMHSHVSLLKFCETLFNLPALNDRPHGEGRRYVRLF